MRLITFFIICLLTGYGASAQESFGIDEDLPSSAEINDEAQKISSFLLSQIPNSMVRSIEKAEKVFCYTVEEVGNGYDGYTAQDSLKITGACGELSDEGQKLMKETLFEKSAIYAKAAVNCQLEPKILLRYIYGMESTDVVISYSCPAVRFYHNRDDVIVNATPGKKLLEKIVSAYEKLRAPYISPAALDQVVANGYPLNQSQSAIAKRITSSGANLRKWGEEKPVETDKNDKKDNNNTPQSGWNRLK